MPNIRSLARSFAGGEVTPEFFGRIDDIKYQTGLATCRNFIIYPHGPAANRPGTAFVRAVKDSTKRTRLIPFTFSTTQTFAIELGAGYFRFHTMGATLLAGSPTAWSNATAYVVGSLVSRLGINYYCILAHTNQQPPNATYWYALPASGVYEIPNPYAEADLFDIHYVQSSDVLTLVHPGYAPRELRRLGATNWQLVAIPFVSDLLPPGSPVATPTTGAATGPIYTYNYKVTALDDTNINQSLPSVVATCSNRQLSEGVNYNTITFSAVVGATRYNVYKQSNGLYGYVGQTDTLSFTDDNIVADVSTTPPIQNNPFNSTNNYPGAVSYFEQRRCFAGTNNKPQTLWMTQSGTESNLSYSIPTQDTDAISFRIAARESNVIRHLIPLSDLLLLTSSAEFRVTSVNSDAITPTSVSVKPQAYIGASNVQPVIINNSLIYPAARGSHMRELAFSFQANGYSTGDLSLRAPHLFDGYDIVDMAYAKCPQPIVWAVSSSGDLLGITYVPEQQIGGWHHHDTGTTDVFESVTVVAEGAEDAVYVVVKRTINGSPVRYVERFASRRFATPADAFFVDCGATYDGVPNDVITGLTWLEGCTVSILADGAVHPQRVVTGGSITLDQEASKIHIGLPIEADVQTLPFYFEKIPALAQGRQKNVNKVWIRVFESSGIFAGPTFDKLTEAKQRTTEPYGSPPTLKSEEIPIVITPTWADSGGVCVRQSDPLPLTLVSMTIEVAIGA